MPYHLELGSGGHSFNGKAIVVNSKTGEHKSLHPIPLAKAEAQKRILDKVVEAQERARAKKAPAPPAEEKKEVEEDEGDDWLTHHLISSHRHAFKRMFSNHVKIRDSQLSEFYAHKIEKEIGKGLIAGEVDVNKYIGVHFLPRGFGIFAKTKEPPPILKKIEDYEAKRKAKIHIPKINTLPGDLQRLMYDKLSGVEDTHEYNLGLGHPTEYLLGRINKYKTELWYWGRNDSAANRFLDDVIKYVKQVEEDAIWRGEPQKMILLDDWQKIFNGLSFLYYPTV